MKCPYPDCQKDYNDDDWPKAMEEWISPSGMSGSQVERESYNRLFVVTRRCRFCSQFFHEIHVGHENFDSYRETKPTLELLVTYPVSKVRFESRVVPKDVIAAFNEAERCRSVGSLTGSGGCLRKAVYTLCDALGVPGADYKEKIGALPVKDRYRDLIKQIKWLGDNTTKPGKEKYTMAMVDVALEILPVLVDDIYLREEKTDKAAKLLAKARSVNSKPGEKANKA